MAKMAVIKTGGKQYLVKENDEIVVDHITNADKGNIDLDTLAIFSDEGTSMELGSPLLTKKIKAQVLEEGKGVKVRVAKFKSKVRYRKVRGFRAMLTKIKILAI